MKHKNNYPLKFPFYVGFQIHQQLKGKLFCSCKLNLKASTKKYTSSLVEITKETVNTNKIQYVSNSDVCNYELDQKEPRINEVVLKEALIIRDRLILSSRGVNEIESFSFIRKRILDGSLYNGFQRTAIIGKTQDLVINLEEDSCLKRKDNYDLSRQGIALLEVASRRYKIKNEENFQYFLNLVEKIGLLIRENDIIRSSGSIRQDLNISKQKGVKVEIKGVSSLSRIRLIIEKELERQDKLLPYGYETKEQTRTVTSIDTGETRFLREYKGNSRYFSEPELSVYTVQASKKEIEKRELEHRILNNLLNSNLQKEIDKVGLVPFIGLLNKNKINSLIQLTIGQISSKLQGNKLLSFFALKKKTITFSEITEARKYLNENNFGFNKYDLALLYNQTTKEDPRISVNNKKKLKQYLKKKPNAEWIPLLILDSPGYDEKERETRKEILKEYLRLYH